MNNKADYSSPHTARSPIVRGHKTRSDQRGIKWLLINHHSSLHALRAFYDVPVILGYVLLQHIEYASFP